MLDPLLVLVLLIVSSLFLFVVPMLAFVLGFERAFMLGFLVALVLGFPLVFVLLVFVHPLVASPAAERTITGGAAAAD